MRGKCQKEKKLAREAMQVMVSMLRNTRDIELRHMKRGKYFRIVADVYADGENVGESLISKGLTGKYKDWCK